MLYGPRLSDKVVYDSFQMGGDRGVGGVGSNNVSLVMTTTPARRHHIILPCNDENANKESNWHELEITGGVRNLSSQLWTLTNLTSLFLNDNHLVRLPGDIGRLRMLTHLDVSNNKLRNLPPEIGELFMLKELLLNHNHLRTLPPELGKCFQLQNIGLKGNPLTQELLVPYQEGGAQSLQWYLLDMLQPPSVPVPTRPWITIKEPKSKGTSSGSSSGGDVGNGVSAFTVMCYNVLCDKYATRNLYAYTPAWALNWEYRRAKIMTEIQHYEADIISLQEVETEQYYNFFHPEMLRIGYDGIFSPKSRAKTMNDADRRHVDGCAIFYKTDKFSLVKEHLIEFNQMAMANAEGCGDMLNRVMTKDNIGLAALLKTKENPEKDSALIGNQPLIVSTSHIHWDPEYCDVKLIQSMMLMHELKNFAQEAAQMFGLMKANGSKFDPHSVPLIISGDLNSLPGSGVVEFIANGRIPVNHPDFKDFPYRGSLRKLYPIVDQNGNDYMHIFDLVKAYEDSVMPHTNYTFDFKGVIDYIFCSRPTLSVLGILGPIDEDWFHEYKVVGCPHQHIPSDHFPLVVELELLPKIISPGLVGGDNGNDGNGGSSSSNSSSNNNGNTGTGNNSGSGNSNGYRR